MPSRRSSDRCSEVRAARYGKDCSGARLLSVAPPVPVRVSFESGSGKSAETDADGHQHALASLYLYLASRRLLPTRSYTAPTDFGSIQSLLVRQKVLLSRPEEARALSQATKKKLERLLCELNRELCARAPFNENLLLQRINKGQQLTLPDLSFQSDLIISSVELGGKSLAEHLKARV